MKRRDEETVNKARRGFCKFVLLGTCSLIIPGAAFGVTQAKPGGWYGTTYKPTEHLYGMGIQVDRCIGCGRCVDGCKKENNVPEEPFYFRTWVERYVIAEDGEVTVDSPNGGRDGFKGPISKKRVLKSFFVPRILRRRLRKAPLRSRSVPVGASLQDARSGP